MVIGSITILLGLIGEANDIYGVTVVSRWRLTMSSMDKTVTCRTLIERRTDNTHPLRRVVLTRTAMASHTGGAFL